MLIAEAEEAEMISFIYLNSALHFGTRRWGTWTSNDQNRR